MKKTIDFITAELFLLFTFYQVILMTQISANRFGRLLGIIAFAVITVAAFIPAVAGPALRTLHMGLLIAGLAANFFLKLFNAQVIFSSVRFDKIPTVLNCGIYVFSQIGIFLLILYYLIFRRRLLFARNMKAKTNWKISRVLLIIVILCYALCLGMECVMMFGYRLLIDLNLYCAVMIRIIYFLAFALMSVGFMISHPKTEMPGHAKPKKSGESVPMKVDNDFIIGSDGSEKTEPVEKQETTRAEFDNDFIIGSDGSKTDEPVEKQKTTREEFDNDFIIRSGVENPAETVKPAEKSRAEFDNDYIL